MPFGVRSAFLMAGPSRGDVAFDPVVGDGAGIVGDDAGSGAFGVDTMDRNAGGVEVSEGEGGVRAIGPKADALIAREHPVGAAIRVFAHADKPGHGSRRRGGG